MYNYPMKKILITVSSLVIFSACHDKRDRYAKPVIPLGGGIGGNYSIVVFPRLHDTGVIARIFIKYASNTAPSDTNSYDMAKTSVTATGKEPQVHFDSLYTGTYFIRAIYGAAYADTIIAIDSKAPAETDAYLHLK